MPVVNFKKFEHENGKRESQTNTEGVLKLLGIEVEDLTYDLEEYPWLQSCNEVVERQFVVFEIIAAFEAQLLIHELDGSFHELLALVQTHYKLIQD